MKAGHVLALALTAAAVAQNTYTNTILVANDPSYQPRAFVDPLLVNGWGIALRPPGAGGHFWVSNAGTGTVSTYVGDVHTADGFTPLFQDSLTAIDIPVGSGLRLDGTPLAPVPVVTGQVYNYSATDFVISGEGITAAAKFIFVTGEGTISGWSEFRDAQGVLHRQTRAVITVDQSPIFDDDRLRFTGVAITDFPSNNRLYVTNWTGEDVEVYDHEFNRIPLPPGRFQFPGGPEIYRPWNTQYFRTGPNGEGRVWVTFNLVEDPWEEDPNFGGVAEFDLEGNFIRRLFIATDFNPAADGELRDPWGLAIAPASFGPLAGAMLIANFGDGTIPAYDLTTNRFIDFVRNESGQPMIVDGIWGITFGNGVGLGDSDALYYAAGPNGEADGTFGTVRFTPAVCPVIYAQPHAATACADATAVFTINADGPVAHTTRWQRLVSGNWTDLADGAVADVGTVAGAATDALSIDDVRGSVSLRAIVTNGCGSAASLSAALDLGACPCDPDLTCDGNADQDDVACIINAVAGNGGCACQDPDFNQDGNVDQDDVGAIINVVAGGNCP